eukprot:g4173.t1
MQNDNKGGKGTTDSKGKVVPVSQLSDYIEWGDLVLFKGRGRAAKCLRCLLNSDVDHVAIMVPKDEDSSSTDLRMMESTLPTGVWLCPPDFLIKMRNPNSWYADKFTSVVVRKLVFDRNDDRRRTLWRFSKEMEHRDYEHNFSEIFKAFIQADQATDLSSLFCSELVAEGLKRLGLLRNRHRASNTYLPSHFSGPLSRLLLGRECAYGASLRVDFEDAGTLETRRGLEQLLQRTLEEERTREEAIAKRDRAMHRLKAAVRIRASGRYHLPGASGRSHRSREEEGEGAGVGTGAGAGEGAGMGAGAGGGGGSGEEGEETQEA